MARHCIHVQCPLVHRPPAVSSFRMVRGMDHQPARRRFAACLQFSLILIRDLVKTALKPAGKHAQVDAPDSRKKSLFVRAV